MNRPHDRRVETSSHGIDLAPMLDFVVNLLIFFIITAVFVREAGVAVKRPTNSDADGKALNSIRILEDGEILIDDRAVDIRLVRANTERMRAANDAAGVLILAHEDAPTGTLVAIVDQVHLGGIDDVTFSTVR